MGNLSQYHTGVWCYKSSGFKTAAVLINYFDKYHLFAGKYVDYLKFRKVYIMITEGKHLEIKGIKKIRRISKPMKQSNSTFNNLSVSFPLAVAMFAGFFFDSFGCEHRTDNYFVSLSFLDTDSIFLATTEFDINFSLLLSPLVA